MINESYAKKYCKDDISRIENYDKAVADPMHTWEIHHRLEFTLDGEFAHSHKELKQLDMYYNRPYFELIFLTKSEHRRLHMKSERLSADTKQKIAASLKGRISPMKGKHCSEESRKKMSESAKRRWSRQ